MSALIPGDLRGGKASIETSGGHFIADIVSSYESHEIHTSSLSLSEISYNQYKLL